LPKIVALRDNGIPGPNGIGKNLTNSALYLQARTQHVALAFRVAAQ